MALTDDQKAMLRLLAQREQGYDDIAALSGQSVDGVRAKVRDALAALDGPEAPAGDQKAMLRLLAQREEGYGDIAALSGQSVGDVRAKVNAALAELEGAAAPAAQPPPPPPEPEPPAPPKPAPKPSPPAPKPVASPQRAPRLKLPEDRGAVWGLGAGLAVVLVVVILLATGALNGDESSSSSSSAEADGSGTTASNGSLKPTQAILKPVGGGNASGRALFAKVKKQVVVVVRARGLEPAPKGLGYTISLSKSPNERLPLIATQVNKAGEITGTIPIAPQTLGFLASGFDEMEISLVSAAELSAALKVARQSKKVPDYTGTPVLRGPVTGAIVEAGEAGTVNP